MQTLMTQEYAQTNASSSDLTDYLSSLKSLLTGETLQSGWLRKKKKKIMMMMQNLMMLCQQLMTKVVCFFIVALLLNGIHCK